MTTKLAIAHEWLVTFAGSEKVVDAAAAVFPDAPIYTLYCDPVSLVGSHLEGREIITSFLDRWRFARKSYRLTLPFMPFAWEQFDFANHEIVLSSCHACAKGILTRADQLHICYMHTPIRYAWDLYHPYLKEANLERGLKGLLAKIVLHYIRIWDFAAAQRVDHFIANSRYVADRIRKVYRRDATVIYPPVDVERFTPTAQRDDFYLAMSRFVPYKRVDLIVEAFTKSGRPLKVIGDGPEEAKIRKLAGPNIEFLGFLPDDAVKTHLETCRAFVFAADEDFGIVPVEAQAAGAPVIAYGKGGSVETVSPGKTGLLFPEQTVASLNAAVDDFEATADQYTAAAIADSVQRFSTTRFRRELFDFVADRHYDFFERGKK